MNPETKTIRRDQNYAVMQHPQVMHENFWTMPYRKINLLDYDHTAIKHILPLPGGQQIITWSLVGESFRVWNLEKGIQVGEEWEDKDEGVEIIALSPDGKTMASGSEDGTVKLWNVDMGKVTKEWTGHTQEVKSVCWSPDGGRVVSGSLDKTFRVWDVESGETIIGPINTRENIEAVCYSPDAKMIATGKDNLKIWDANTGELLKTFNCKGPGAGHGFEFCPATSDGKPHILKFDTATLDLREHFINTISIPSNKSIFGSGPYLTNTVQLWNLETNQPIGTPLHHQNFVDYATFSAHGKFLITHCWDSRIYIWEVSAIIEEAGLLSDIADVTPQAVPKTKGVPRIPPGFFDDALREANLRTRLSQSHGPHNHPTPAPSQRTLGRFSSFWRRSKPHVTTEPDIQSPFRPLSWAQNLVSGILRRRDGSDIQLREVGVPHTAGKPRNYHARKKRPAASSSRPPNTRITRQPGGVAQNIPSSSQLPPPATTSTLSAVPGTARAMGTILHPRIIGWRTRFVGWVCCMPIQNADGHH